MVDFNLRSLAKDELVVPERLSTDVENARHAAMMDAIKGFAKPTIQKNLSPVYTDYKRRNTKLALVMCPEWAPEFPPFNLCRLAGITKSAGYDTTIIDLNVKAWNLFVKDWQPNNKLPFRLWDPSASWHWLGDSYYKDIHPLLEPLLLEWCDKIQDMNVDVVGFSMYYISEEPTKWMAQELKRRMPYIKIAIGGSNVQKDWFQTHHYYDYVVSGEGESAILKILAEVERGIEHEECQIINAPLNNRVNINGLPLPDYESIDFSEYSMPNGVTTEFSRGCTAKCTFCEETHFWKYRQRQAVDLIEEVEWLYYNKGTDVFWFIDSLVNGNLKELRAFCKAVDAKGLDIKWTGYARCDGRMDLEYFKDLKAGGCIMLNYGIESGNQKVLDDMHKGVTVAEMEENFRSAKAVGIYNATNWIVGFPTEEFNDFADSMSFLWRNREMNINNVGAGVGYGLGPETIVGQNPHAYNVSWHKYQGHWITNDFTKGGTHVMHRVKTFHIFLDMMVGCTEVPFGYPIRDNLAVEHYKIKLNNPNVINEIRYEKFDYNIIKADINPFANTLVNEMWPFFRMLWKTRGGFEAEVYFNPEIDLKEFGQQYGPGMYNAVYKFKINDDGQWEADFDMKFDQIDNPYDDRDPPPKGRKGPFYAQDYSRMQSNAAQRSRRLAKPDWDIDEGRDNGDFRELLEEEELLNQTIDFSFEYHYVGSGDWSDYKKYEVDVATKSKDIIPEKEADDNIIKLVNIE